MDSAVREGTPSKSVAMQLLLQLQPNSWSIAQIYDQHFVSLMIMEFASEMYYSYIQQRALNVFFVGNVLE